MMLEVQHVGSRVHPVTGDQYDAFEISSGSSDWRGPGSIPPVFPVGHTFFTVNGKAYEVVASRTVESTGRYSRLYRNSHLCREADPGSL